MFSSTGSSVASSLIGWRYDELSGNRWAKTLLETASSQEDLVNTHHTNPPFRTLGFVCTLIGVHFVDLSSALPAVTVTADLDSPGNRISSDFCGLSFETKMLLPDGDKQHFFRGDNSELISLFKSLGVNSLRIGGNSADAANVDIPSDQDLDQLFAFAEAADVHVIYNLRLKDQSDPADAARIVKHLMEHYRPRITSFTIGNEPNVYITEYSAYRDQWKKFADAILAVVPDAPLNGPSTTPGKTAWARQFAGDFASWKNLRLVTQHSYPGGNAQNATDPAAARLRILSPDMIKSYEKFYQSFVPAVLNSHQQYRLEEANSLFHGGATGVSNSYASALWALDYMHWWASHDAEGINFHTGNRRVTNETQVPGGYDISYSTPSGLKTHPIAYALKAFSFASDGRLVPVSIKAADPQMNLTAYGVLANDSTLLLTLINKDSGSSNQSVAVTIQAGHRYDSAEVLLLQSPGNDVALVSGTTLGGAPIAGDGTWNGVWNKLSGQTRGEVDLHLPPATAAVVRLRSKP
jgi:hypothetical protein